MKKILLSLATILASVGIYLGATGAFFSDTETSEGNIFQAGALDLKIDSKCNYFQLTGIVDGEPTILTKECKVGESMYFGNFAESDLIADYPYMLFNFRDVKPGDWGENTISLHVYDNDAWGRIRLEKVEDYDNTCEEPELLDDPNCVRGDKTSNGELDNAMNAIVWLDQGEKPGFQGAENDLLEGDNIWQGNFEPLSNTDLTSDFSFYLSEILMPAYADALNMGATPEDLNLSGLYFDGRMRGSITYYLGVEWCFGKPMISPLGVFYCDGTAVNNASQTDVLRGNIIFEVEQHRNNPNPFTAF